MKLQHSALQARTPLNHLVTSAGAVAPRELNPCIRSLAPTRPRGPRSSTMGAYCDKQQAVYNRSSAAGYSPGFTASVHARGFPFAPLDYSDQGRSQRHALACGSRRWGSSSATRSTAAAATGEAEATAEETPALSSGARVSDLDSRAKLAVFVSGEGSNLKALHEETRPNRTYNDISIRGTIKGSIVVVVSDNPGCGGWSFAESEGIKVMQFPSKKHKPGEHAVSLEALPAALQDLGIDFICLAGFLKLIPVELVKAFPRRILNIHPALLPAFGGAGFYGERVHRAVVASGARYTGPTIHFVDEEYDTGPILAQEAFRVDPSDSVQEIARRVLQEEHYLYPKAVAALCDNRVSWRKDGVPIIWDGECT